MMRSLIIPVKITLAVACAALALPHPVFAQEHGSHTAIETSPMQEPIRTHGNHHGSTHEDHGAAAAPTATHQHMPGIQHGAVPQAEHAHTSPNKEALVSKGQKMETVQDVEHDAGHGTPSQRQPETKGPSAGMETASISGMKMGRMQGGKAPPGARDPDAYAEGLTRQPMHGMEMADDELFGSLTVNELEYRDSNRNGHGQSLDMEAWYGGDYNKVWLKAEGERRSGQLEHLRTEIVWDRVFAPFWSTQFGIRHDTGEGPSRNWLAFGVRGLAPYWIHTEATAYAGTHGAFAARAEARYDLLLTQRLVLQPRIEANLFSKNDVSRRIGSGLSDVELGLRLRYEIRRQFAPYIGINWKHLYGNTADYARDAGEKVSNTEYVAGIRFWF